MKYKKKKKLKTTLTKDEEKKLRQEWRTPKVLIDVLRKEFKINTDVACSDDNCIFGKDAFSCQKITEKHDAFRIPWFYNSVQTVFCNPPFGRPVPWIDRAIEQVSGGPGRTVVLVLNAGIGTKWFSKLEDFGAEIRLMSPRIQYDPPPGIEPTSNDRDCLVIILRTPPATGKRPSLIWQWRWKEGQ